MGAVGIYFLKPGDVGATNKTGRNTTLPAPFGPHLVIDTTSDEFDPETIHPSTGNFLTAQVPTLKATNLVTLNYVFNKSAEKCGPWSFPPWIR